MPRIVGPREFRGRMIDGQRQEQELRGFGFGLHRRGPGPLHCSYQPCLSRALRIIASGDVAIGSRHPYEHPDQAGRARQRPDRLRPSCGLSSMRPPIPEGRSSSLGESGAPKACPTGIYMGGGSSGGGDTSRPETGTCACHMPAFGSTCARALDGMLTRGRVITTRLLGGRFSMNISALP
jgi:hypothetical protein